MTKNTVILTHAGADLDAIASAFACVKLFPNACVIHPGSTDINAQKVIGIFGEILNFKKVRDLPKDFIDNIFRVVVVDTKFKGRIGDGKELLNKSGVEIVVIDHHQGKTDIKNAICVTKAVGANTTILVNLLRLKKVKLNPIEATILALGIYEDTGSLSFPSVTAEDFKALEFLFSFGVDMKLIHRFTSPFLEESQVNLLKKLLDNLKEYTINGVKIGITTAELEKYIPGVSLLAHKIIEMIDVDAVFVLVKLENTIHIIGRSTSESINLTQVADALNGGGHPTAISAVVKDETLDSVIEKIIKELNTSNFYNLKAKDIMSTPVKTIPPNTTVREALKIMVMMGFSGLPIEEDGKIIGIVEKKNIEKAYLLNKKNCIVKQFYSPKVVTVSISDSLRDIEEKMVEEDVGRVLVEHNGKIVGIISRSDLLKAYKVEDISKEISQGYHNVKLPDRKFVVKAITNSIPKNILDLIKDFGKIAKSIGSEIYLVGGSVRDAFLRKPIVDFDFVLKDAVSFGEKLKEKYDGIIEIFKDIQTVHFEYLGYNFDFVTSRREYYIDNSLVPVVEKASLKEDLSRRDFTINAMAIDITEENFGKLIDYYGGYEDLLQKTIRVIKPFSFIEDPSRILRAIKYMVELDFKLSYETEILLKKAIELGVLRSSKSQRVQNELKELLYKDNIDKIIQLFHQFGLMEEIFRVKKIPKIAINSIKRFYKENQDKEERVLAFIFFVTFSKKTISFEELSLIFGIRKRTFEKMKEAISIIKEAEKEFKQKDNADIVILLNRIDERFVRMYYYRANKEFRTFLKEYLTKLRFIRNELSGDDLKKLGLKEGSQYRTIFETLTKLKLKGEIASKEDEIKYILEHKGEYEWK